MRQSPISTSLIHSRFCFWLRPLRAFKSGGFLVSTCHELLSLNGKTLSGTHVSSQYPSSQTCRRAQFCSPKWCNQNSQVISRSLIKVNSGRFIGGLRTVQARHSCEIYV